jgi:hypothetical protein
MSRLESTNRFGRRAFLGALGGLSLARLSQAQSADQSSSAHHSGSKIHDPRTISGDSTEQAWDEMLTLTVGPKDADLVGSTERVIQAAADSLARSGGGTLRILPGTYRFRNAVYLPSKIRIQGSGPETILIKEPSTTTKLLADSDWYDQEITLADPAGFRVGDGVCLQAKNPHHGGPTVIKRTLVARSGNRFKLDRALRENLWLQGNPTAATLFPLFSGENISEVQIESLALDGNKANNENLNGNYAGCIFLQDCNRVTIRDVIARNYNGDGISWQICHDVMVENCQSHDHAGLGLHPGSGSQRPVMRNNRLSRNEIGIFFCWGVRFGLAEGNTIEEIRTAGISFGHRDTDNIARDNTILRSGQVGILFRDETEAFGAHRNRCERNRVIDSGPADGVGIDVQGRTNAVTLSGNEIRESRSPGNRIGIRIGPKAREITLEGNQIQGYAVGVSDLRTS